MCEGSPANSLAAAVFWLIGYPHGVLLKQGAILPPKSEGVVNGTRTTAADKTLWNVTIFKFLFGYYVHGGVFVSKFTTPLTFSSRG